MKKFKKKDIDKIPLFALSDNSLKKQVRKAMNVLDNIGLSKVVSLLGKCDEGIESVEGNKYDIIIRGMFVK